MINSLPVPVALRLMPRRLTYKLDLGGQSAQAFRDMIKRLEDESTRRGWKQDYPPTPAVDFDLEIVNLADQEIQVLLGGSAHPIGIEMEGPGVLPFAPVIPVPAMMCPPATIPLAPGSKYSMAMRQLAGAHLPSINFGSSFLYWIEPGAYVLKAFWHAGISPAPAGSQVDGQGFGQRTILSDPVTVHVV